MIVVCLINLFEAHAPNDIFITETMGVSWSLRQQGLHPDPDTDRGEKWIPYKTENRDIFLLICTDLGGPVVKHEIHTNKIIGSLLLKRWQNESNYGSFCHRPGIICWSRALLVIGPPQCLRPQGWSITGKTRLV